MRDGLGTLQAKMQASQDVHGVVRSELMSCLMMSPAGLLVLQPNLGPMWDGLETHRRRDARCAWHCPVLMSCVMMSPAGLLVLQPDVLLSGTRVAGSFKCARQAVLEERFGGDSGAKAVEGTLLHVLFQVRHWAARSFSSHHW